MTRAYFHIDILTPVYILSFWNHETPLEGNGLVKPSDLPDAEMEILACLHRLGGSATARELREAMAGFRPMAHGSMATLLRRLEAKSIVKRRKGNVGKAYLYQAVHNSQATFRPLLKKLVTRLFGGDGVALVASLFETHPPTREEIRKLEAMLADLRRPPATKRREK